MVRLQGRRLQYAATISASLLNANSGMAILWPSPVLPILYSEDSPIGETISWNEGSWVASLLLIGSVFGNIMLGVQVNYFGRRGALLIASVPIFISWILILFARSVTVLYVLKFFQCQCEELSWVTSVSLLGYVVGNMGVGKLLDILGRKKLLLISAVPIVLVWMMILFAKNATLLIIARFISGMAHVVPTMGSVIYIGEIAEADIRGKLGMFNLLMVEFGQLLITVVGNYCSYQITAITAAVIPIIFVVTFYWMPESPYYHMRKGEVDNARKCLARVRPNLDVEKEIKEIQYNVEKEMKNNTNFLELFRKPNYRKTVLIILGLKTLQQMSGNLAINSYMKTIFNQASTGLNSSESTIIATGITIPAMIVASYIIDCGGRKPLYYVSTLGLSLALTCEATYFYLQNIVKLDMISLSWMPLSGVFFFNIFRVIGVQPIPYILTSELFPINIKGHAVSVTLMYSSLLGFFVSLGFPYVTELWDMYGGFLIFAICCFLGFFFVLIFVPETKAKSLGDIQDDIEEQCDK